MFGSYLSQGRQAPPEHNLMNNVFKEDESLSGTVFLCNGGSLDQP